MCLLLSYVNLQLLSISGVYCWWAFAMGCVCSLLERLGVSSVGIPAPARDFSLLKNVQTGSRGKVAGA